MSPTLLLGHLLAADQVPVGGTKNQELSPAPGALELLWGHGDSVRGHGDTGDRDRGQAGTRRTQGTWGTLGTPGTGPLGQRGSRDGEDSGDIVVWGTQGRWHCGGHWRHCGTLWDVGDTGDGTVGDVGDIGDIGVHGEPLGPGPAGTRGQQGHGDNEGVP